MAYSIIREMVESKISVRPNSFIDGFLASTKPLLEDLAQIQTEIDQEKAGWLQSKAAEELVDRILTLLQSNGLYTPNPKFRQEQIKIELATLYGQIKESQIEKVNNFSIDNKRIRQLPKIVRDELDIITELETEHRKHFQEAIAPLAQQRKVTTSELIGRWKAFITADYFHFEDFDDFLSKEEFSDVREQPRPFLQALERFRMENSYHTDILDEVKTETIKRILIDPQEGIFYQFMEDLTKRRPSRGGSSDVLGWLEFISFPADGIDSSVVFNRIRSSGLFPTSLRNLFSGFVEANLNARVIRVRQSLALYKEQTPNLNASLSLQTSFRKRGSLTYQDTRVLPKNIQSPEIPPRPEYKLILHGNEQVSEEGLDRFIEKTAKSFAPNDQRMREDIKTIIDSLVDDPYGLGAGKLVVMSIPSPYSNRRVALRRYRADERPGVVLKHPDSKTLRSVYYFDKEFDPYTVILHDILRHDEFDSKYTS